VVDVPHPSVKFRDGHLTGRQSSYDGEDRDGLARWVGRFYHAFTVFGMDCVAGTVEGADGDKGVGHVREVSPVVPFRGRAEGAAVCGAYRDGGDLLEGDEAVAVRREVARRAAVDDHVDAGGRGRGVSLVLAEVRRHGEGDVVVVVVVRRAD